MICWKSLLEQYLSDGGEDRAAHDVDLSGLFEGFVRVHGFFHAHNDDLGESFEVFHDQRVEGTVLSAVGGMVTIRYLNSLDCLTGDTFHHVLGR